MKMAYSVYMHGKLCQVFKQTSSSPWQDFTSRRKRSVSALMCAVGPPLSITIFTEPISQNLAEFTPPYYLMKPMSYIPVAKMAKMASSACLPFNFQVVNRYISCEQ